MEFTLNLGDQGFNNILIQNAIEVLRDEVNAIMYTYKNGGDSEVVEDYQIDSSWFNLATVNA
jgi:hypothetical protein